MQTKSSTHSTKIAIAATALATTFSPNASFAQKTLDAADICKAAIAYEMGRPTKSMKTTKNDPNLPEISYTRKEDGQKFRYNCKIQGGQVIWRAYFNDPVQVGWGRWRNQASDSFLTFEKTDTKIIITNNATGDREVFSSKDF